MLETDFDVCREGWVAFSHPTNQKPAAGSNLKPSETQQTAGRQAGRQKQGASAGPALALLGAGVLCFSQIYSSSLLDLSQFPSKREESTHAPTMHSPSLG
jgi:hypothetical protein